jgi:hypothetical protein
MRKTLIIALMCAASVAACKKAEDASGGPAVGAPPLLAGVDEGAKPGDPGYVAGVSRGTTDGTTMAAAPAPVAADGSRPLRKAGLWQLTTVSTGGPAFGGAGGGRPGGPNGGPAGGEARGPGAPGGAGSGGFSGGRPGGAGGPGGGFAGGPPGPVTLCVDAESEAVRGVFSAGRTAPGCEPKLAKAGKGWSASFTCNQDIQGQSVKRVGSQSLSGDLSSKYTVHGTTTISGATGDMARMNSVRTTTVTGVYKGACPAGQRGGDQTGADGQTRNILTAQGGGRRQGGGNGGGE